ncbi:MAG: hypothetical protein K1X51_07560 [Rhodospirillaceae bacterium]|nr:hypothetical protein [Rhodospirillaceae bacterium]
MGLLLSILKVLGLGHVTVHEDGFDVKRGPLSAHIVWDEIEEVYGTLTYGYETFSIVLNGERELDLCFDLGKTALISAFMRRLPGFPRDWFSAIRDNGPDDVSLLWKKGQEPPLRASQGLSAAYNELMRVLDPPPPERTLDQDRVGRSNS